MSYQSISLVFCVLVVLISYGQVYPAVVFNQYAKDNLETEVLQVNKPNKTLETELSKLQKLVDFNVTCLRGEPYKNPREEFLLWSEVPALCDTVTDGGGWIVIQRRIKGDVDFYRDWDDYKKGFGTPDTDFWLGNGIIHNLTDQGYTELRIDMEFEGRQYFAHYSNFSVANETSRYRLSVSGYNGSSGDALTNQNGWAFSTFDRDHINCAERFHGAWWYKNCYHSNLNGLWGGEGSVGIIWLDLSDSVSLNSTEMKIRLV